MADIKLDIQWDIAGDGSLNIEVTPTGAPAYRLGSLEFDIDMITENLDEELGEYRATSDASILTSWSAMADFFEEAAGTIRDRIEDAINKETQARREVLAKALLKLGRKPQ